MTKSQIQAFRKEHALTDAETVELLCRYIDTWRCPQGFGQFLLKEARSQRAEERECDASS